MLNTLYLSGLAFRWWHFAQLNGFIPIMVVVRNTCHLCHFRFTAIGTDEIILNHTKPKSNVYVYVFIISNTLYCLQLKFAPLCFLQHYFFTVPDTQELPSIPENVSFDLNMVLSKWKSYFLYAFPLPSSREGHFSQQCYCLLIAE